MVSDGPAKSWAIGSTGSAPSSSRVRPFRQLLLRIRIYYIFIYTYILIYLSLFLFIYTIFFYLFIYFLFFFKFIFILILYAMSSLLRLASKLIVHDMFNEYFFFFFSLRTERKTCRGYFSALFLHASLFQRHYIYLIVYLSLVEVSMRISVYIVSYYVIEK